MVADRDQTPLDQRRKIPVPDRGRLRLHRTAPVRHRLGDPFTEFVVGRAAHSHCSISSSAISRMASRSASAWFDQLLAAGSRGPSRRSPSLRSALRRQPASGRARPLSFQSRAYHRGKMRSRSREHLFELIHARGVADVQVHEVVLRVRVLGPQPRDVLRRVQHRRPRRSAWRQRQHHRLTVPARPGRSRQSRRPSGRPVRRGPSARCCRSSGRACAPSHCGLWMCPSAT